jgi:hypothetical protein
LRNVSSLKEVEVESLQEELTAGVICYYIGNIYRLDNAERTDAASHKEESEEL